MKRFIFAFLLSIVTVVSYSVPAYASTEVIQVDGDGSSSWGYVGAPATWANMNSLDDTTYAAYSYGAIPIGPITTYADWTFGNMVATPSTVNSITFTVRIKPYCTSSRLYYLNGGTRYTLETLSTSGSGWQTVTTSAITLNPKTGAAWVKAGADGIDAAVFGISATMGDAYVGGYYCYLSYISPSIDYVALAAPTVTTQAVSAITPTTATGNGTVVSNGGGALTEKGICYKAGASGDPTTADSTVHDHVDSLGAYTEAIAGLTKGTAYRARAYAINVTGTGYGVTEGFTTIGDPTISTSAASLVSSTTARLNSNVTFDGSVVTGEPCTVTFVYVEDGAGAPYANYAAVLAEGGSTQTAVAGTWTTGQLPYLDISGLTLSGDYSFAVKIINSTTTTAYGSVLTFTTESGVYIPTNFTAIPTATSVSLAWAKGVGAQYTMVRYSDAAYPAVITDGIVAYLDTGNSKTLTGLTPGTTYYFSAWGKTGAVYSGTPATYADGEINALATTLAYDTATSTGTIEAPPSNSWWNQTPSTTKVGSIPLVSALISTNATVYAIPEASLWYFLWVLFSVGLGVIIYVKSSMNLVAGLGSQALLFALGAVLGLTMLWIMVIFMVIGAGFTLWGNRH